MCLRANTNVRVCFGLNYTLPPPAVDITVFHNGFHGDLNETFFVGDVDEEARKLVQTTYECLMQAIDSGKGRHILLACPRPRPFADANNVVASRRPTVKPGIRYRELGNIIQKHAQANGFSVVRSYCGHGIHRLFHTAPNVPHYASE